MLASSLLLFLDGKTMNNQINEADIAKLVTGLKELATFKDIEAAHIQADDMLCWLLEQLGYKEVVDAYEDINKWYA